MNNENNYNLGFLASGNGSNVQAIVDACKSGILPMTAAVIISNNPDSGVLKRADTEGIPSVCINSHTHPNELDRDIAIRDTLLKYCVGIVILAGYMKAVGPKTLEKFPTLNIHPALLPLHGGKGMYGIRVHEAVIASHDKVTGATVHLVDPLYDHGKILNQIAIPVLDGDTAESLQARVLKMEHFLFVDTLMAIVSGEIKLKEFH